MQLRSIALAALAAASFSAQADNVALWDFNTFSCSSACTDVPKGSTANGGKMSTVGGTTFTSAGGVTGNAFNSSTYAAQNTGDLTRGVQFMIDTSGYTDLVFSFAQRNSNTASAYTMLQYTLDGSTWINATTFLASTSFATQTFSFSDVAEADNNEHFGIRLLATFKPGTNAYLPTSGSTYGISGTMRYDDVLLTGTAIPDPTSPIPEPHTCALMLGGLAVVGLLARRRRAN